MVNSLASNPDKKYQQMTIALVSIFVSIFLLFLFSNVSVILSKLGFETATALKAELVRTQEEVKKLATVNSTLASTVEILEKAKKTEIEAIVSYYEETNKAKTTVSRLVEEKDKKDAILVQQIKEIKPVATVNIVSEQQQQKLSESNIVLIISVYNDFFPNTGTEVSNTIVYDQDSLLDSIFNTSSV
jgi:hypothetical protein